MLKYYFIFLCVPIFLNCSNANWTKDSRGRLAQTTETELSTATESNSEDAHWSREEADTTSSASSASTGGHAAQSIPTDPDSAATDPIPPNLRPAKPIPPKPTPTKPVIRHTESFTVRSPAPTGTSVEYRDVHMLWVVDNSPSMADDIEAVKAGISSFVAELKSRTGVEVAMITSVGSNTKTQIPSAVLSRAGIHAVDIDVPSTKKLDLVANYLQLSSKDAHPRHPSGVFFRASSDALKVFVMVTDEEENNLLTRYSSDSFLERLRKKYGDLYDFRFIGFLSSRDEKGRYKSYIQYSMLIRRLGGESYDIKEASPEQWKSIMGTARSRLLSMSTTPRGQSPYTSVTLQHNVIRIINVKLGGRDLSRFEYFLRGNKLTIKMAYLKGGETVEVEYESL